MKNFKITLLAALSVVASRALTVGPGQLYTNIQSGINNASLGESVEILPGCYEEALTLRSGINLIGRGTVTLMLWSTNVGSTVTDNNQPVQCSLQNLHIVRSGVPTSFALPDYHQCNGLWLQHTGSVVRCVNVKAQSSMGHGVYNWGTLSGVVGYSTKLYDHTNSIGGAEGIFNHGTLEHSEGYGRHYNGIKNYSLSTNRIVRARYCYGETEGDYGKGFVNFGAGTVADFCSGYTSGKVVWAFYNNGGVARHCSGVALQAGGFVNTGYAFQCVGEGYGTTGASFGFQTSNGGYSVDCDGRSVSGSAIEIDTGSTHLGGRGLATGNGPGVKAVGDTVVADLHGKALGIGAGIFAQGAKVNGGSGYSYAGHGAYAEAGAVLVGVKGIVQRGQSGIFVQDARLVGCSGVALEVGRGLIVTGQANVTDGSYVSMRPDIFGSAIYLTGTTTNNYPRIANVSLECSASGAHAIEADTQQHAVFVGVKANRGVATNVAQLATQAIDAFGNLVQP